MGVLKSQNNWSCGKDKLVKHHGFYFCKYKKLYIMPPYSQVVTCFLDVVKEMTNATFRCFHYSGHFVIISKTYQLQMKTQNKSNTRSDHVCVKNNISFFHFPLITNNYKKVSVLCFCFLCSDNRLKVIFLYSVLPIKTFRQKRK